MNRFSNKIIGLMNKSDAWKTANGVPKIQIIDTLHTLPMSMEAIGIFFNTLWDVWKATSLNEPDSGYFTKFDILYLLTCLSDEDMDELIINWKEQQD